MEVLVVQLKQLFLAATLELIQLPTGFESVSQYGSEAYQILGSERPQWSHLWNGAISGARKITPLRDHCVLCEG